MVACGAGAAADADVGARTLAAAVDGRQIALLIVVASLTAVFALLLVPLNRIATWEAQQVCTHGDRSAAARACDPTDALSGRRLPLSQRPKDSVATAHRTSARAQLARRGSF